MFRKILLIIAGTLFIFWMSRLSFAMMCGEHSGQKQMAQTHAEHEQGAAETTNQTLAEKTVNVGNKTCPISGEKIDEKAASRYEYQGKIYNFCCPACIDEFKKDPEKYIKKVEEELKVTESGAVQGAVLSGEMQNGVRLIKVIASKYKFTPDPAVVKLGEKVRFIITSSDVTHGLAIKEFKVNAVIRHKETAAVEFVANKEGKFRVFCSVYCGPGHSHMHSTLIVLK